MNGPVISGNDFQIGLKRSSLEGTVIYACRKCGAPGVYSAHESIQQGWPGCYDPTRAQLPVGDECPNCHTYRQPNKNLGELQSSIPLWAWKTVLFLKRCYINIQRRR